MDNDRHLVGGWVTQEEPHAPVRVTVVQQPVQEAAEMTVRVASGSDAGGLGEYSSGTPMMVRERAEAAAETMLAFIPELRVENLIADLEAGGAKPVAAALRKLLSRT